MRFCYMGERLGSTPNTTRKSGTLEPKSRWGSVIGKLLRGNTG